MSALTMVEALNQALHYEMNQDKEVIVLGEDVGQNGGVFRVTDRLCTEFPHRVLDTPLAESMIAGASIGMATQGLKPVAEFQFMGFIHPAMDHILNHASRMRTRTSGRLHCPIVFRAPFGGGIRAPEHHSESYEALFAHLPGLRVVIPSTPQKAYGLLLAAIRDPDPIVFLEPKRVYRAIKQEVPDNGVALPLDTAFISREGDDVTLVSWGAMLQETLQAATKLAEDNISAEVIDLATIKPLDINTIMNSIEKTGRCVIVHEAHRTGGVGAEISAQIMEYGFDLLKAPVQRVTGFDTVMPYFKSEHLFLPSVDKIKRAVQVTLEYT